MENLDSYVSGTIVLVGLGIGLYFVFREKDPVVRELKRKISILNFEIDRIKSILRDGQEVTNYETFDYSLVEPVGAFSLVTVRDITVKERADYEQKLAKKISQLNVFNICLSTRLERRKRSKK